MGGEYELSAPNRQPSPNIDGNGPGSGTWSRQSIRTVWDDDLPSLDGHRDLLRPAPGPADPDPIRSVRAVHDDHRGILGPVAGPRMDLADRTGTSSGDPLEHRPGARGIAGRALQPHSKAGLGPDASENPDQTATLRNPASPPIRPSSADGSRSGPLTRASLGSRGRAINGGRKPVQCRASPRRITPASSGAGSPATSPTCHGRFQACERHPEPGQDPGGGPEAPWTRQNTEYRGAGTRRSVIAATVRIGACHRRRSIPPGCRQSAWARISGDLPTAPRNPQPFPRRWCP